LQRCHVDLRLARAHLIYGEWLAEEHRQQQALEHLLKAHDIFERIRAENFAERACRQLARLGFTIVKPASSATATLSAQESLIARLAGSGHTNREIGTEQFISPRTVEWHLRNIYNKLGISSRRELRVALES
jgi:DNA-binding CsgD family transcriptional regulator